MLAWGCMRRLLLILCLEIFKSLKNPQNIYKRMQIISNRKNIFRKWPKLSQKLPTQQGNTVRFVVKKSIPVWGASSHFSFFYFNTSVFDTTYIFYHLTQVLVFGTRLKSTLRLALFDSCKLTKNLMENTFLESTRRKGIFIFLILKWYFFFIYIRETRSVLFEISFKIPAS